MAHHRQWRQRRAANQSNDALASVVPPGLPGGWYKPLTDNDITRIHEASLTVLERTGIEVQPSEGRDILQKAGCKVDTALNRVYIPRDLVEEAITQAPSEVVLCGREARHDLRLGGRKVYMGTGGAAVKILDLDTQHARETTLADVGRIGKLVDALDNIHFYLRACVARDLPNDLLDTNTYYAAITKHVTTNCFTVESLRDVIEMASLIAGGRGNVLFYRSSPVGQSARSATRRRRSRC